MTRRPSAAAPLVAALAIVLALLGAYVVGYFRLGYVFEDQDGWTGDISYERRYEDDWQASLFHPAAAMESVARGVPVSSIEDPFADLRRDR
jgi:hypothetical protein